MRFLYLAYIKIRSAMPEDSACGSALKYQKTNGNTNPIKFVHNSELGQRFSYHIDFIDIVILY